MLEVGKPPTDEALEETIVANELDAAGASFTRALVHAILAHETTIDAIISEHAIGYPADRQTVVDRSILRLALAEIEHGIGELAHGISANEAVELAKKYSTPEAARFVNGVLGAVIRQREARVKPVSGDDMLLQTAALKEETDA